MELRWKGFLVIPKKAIIYQQNQTCMTMKAKPTYEELERRVHELKTDNTQLEKKLLEASSFTEEVMTYMTEGFVLADTRGTVIAINQRLSEMLGYLPEEITGRCWLDMVSIEQQVIAREEEDRRAHGHVSRYEIVLRRKTGENFPVLICAGPRFDKQNGQYIGSMAVVNDITERKQAEDELKSNYALLQIAGETAKFGGWSVDLRNNICTWSDAVADIHDVPHGYAPPVQEAINFYAPEWREKIKQIFSACAKKGIPYDEEMEIITQKGKRVWARATGKAVKNEKDKIIKVHGSFQDITDSKHQRENLRLSESRYRKAQELAKVGNWEYDLKTKEFWGSDEAKKIFELDPDQDSFSIEEIESCIPERERVHQATVDLIENGKPYNLEYDIINKGTGKIKTVVSIAEIEHDGAQNPVKISGVIHDITERKQAEATLRETEERIRTIGDNLQGAQLYRFRVSPDGSAAFTYVSSKVEELHECKPKDVLKDASLLFKRVHPADVAEWQKITHKSLRELTTYDHTVRIVRKSGEIRWHRMISKPKKLDDGSVLFDGVEFDVTESKRAEEALRESLTRYDELVANVPVGVYVFWIRANGRLEFEYVSDRWCEIHQLKREDVLADAMRANNQVHPDDRDNFGVCNQESFRNRIPFFWEGRFLLGDGKLRWLRLESTPFVFDNGDIRWFGMTSDITERKLAEEALRESEAQLRSIYEHTAVGLAQVSLDFKIMSVNEAYCNMLGYQEKDLVGCHLAEITHPDVIEKNIQKQVALASGTIDHFRMEKIFIHKSGQAVHAILDANLIRDASGKANYFLGSVVDITDRKKAEKALQESEERFKKLSSFTFEGIVIHNNAIAIDFNQSFVRMLGYEREDIIGTNLFKFIHPDDHEKTKVNLSKKVATPYEIRIIRKEGSTFYAEIEARNISYNNEYFRVACVRDITERKQAEAEKEKLHAHLNQAQKIESVGRLAGGIAHDFNNMLGVIIGHTEMALNEVDSSAPLYANLQAVQQAAEHSADLTRQLLTFARKQTIAPKVINLNKTVKGMLKMLRRLIGEDIDLLWKPGGNLAPVKVDSSQIGQILVNLCVNARDAIIDVGKITIETGVVSFDEAYCAVHAGFLPGEYVLLAVSDNGCGMDQETIGHLFEPFFTTKEPGKGTGLGLASVYGAIKQNNGFINVYSEPGQGTTFKIYLPQYHASAPRHADKTTAKPIAGGSETILLVEDEPAILDMATMMLKRLEYIVIAAKTPGEAIRLAHEHSGSIDLLLTDVVMPEMNGRDLAKNLLTIYPGIRRLFMSGYTANVIAHHGVLDEGVHFIQKPFSLKDLGAKLREILEDKDAT